MQIPEELRPDNDNAPIPPYSWSIGEMLLVVGCATLAFGIILTGIIAAFRWGSGI